MADIRHLLDKIRKAIYGKEVRGSLADGLEAVNNEVEDATEVAVNVEQRQDAVEQQFNTLLGEWSDDKPIDNAETIAARTNTKESKTYENLGKRLDEEYGKVTAQLADGVSQVNSIEHANAKEPLEIVNYLGNIQNIHPKVLFFENQFNGFFYWMAYTPYPNGDTSAENPCIAVSNDMIHWSVPDGLINPLDPQPSYGYNSDTHLVYRGDIKQLEIWWRPHNPTTGESWLYRRTSMDGINWTPKQQVYYAPDSATDPLSPAILFEDNKYKMWAVNRHSKEVVYLESADALNWINQEVVPIEWGDLTPWHLDVIRTDRGLEFAIQAWQRDNGNNNAELYYVLQKKEGSFTKPRMMIKKSSKPNAFDRVSIYRSSILKHPHNNQYYLFYTALGGAGYRSIALASGSEPTGLNGFDVELSVPYRFGENFKLESSATLTNYDVEKIDNIFFSGNNIINSFKGGYRGKRLMLILNAGSAVVTLKPSNNLQLPKYNEIIMDINSSMALELVCTNTIGDQWKVINYVNERSSFRMITSDDSLIDYDMSETDLLLVSSSNLAVNSFTGGYIGKRIDISINSSSAKVTFKYSNRLLLPNKSDFTLDTTNGLVSFICINTAGTTWRLVSS